MGLKDRIFSYLVDVQMGSESFENVKNQIGYCRIWCGSCAVGNGPMQELSLQYGEIINNYGLKEWTPNDFDFNEFIEGLSSIKSVSQCPGCLKGGRRSNCEIRTCAIENGLNICNECDKFSLCSNVIVLNNMRNGQNLRD